MDARRGRARRPGVVGVAAVVGRSAIIAIRQHKRGKCSPDGGEVGGSIQSFPRRLTRPSGEKVRRGTGEGGSTMSGAVLDDCGSSRSFSVAKRRKEGEERVHVEETLVVPRKRAGAADRRRRANSGDAIMKESFAVARRGHSADEEGDGDVPDFPGRRRLHRHVNREKTKSSRLERRRVVRERPQVPAARIASKDSVRAQMGRVRGAIRWPRADSPRAQPEKVERARHQLRRVPEEATCEP